MCEYVSACLCVYAWRVRERVRVYVRVHARESVCVGVRVLCARFVHVCKRGHVCVRMRERVSAYVRARAL